MEKRTTIELLKVFENYGPTNEDVDMGITGEDLVAYHPIPTGGMSYFVESKINPEVYPPHLTLKLSGDWSKEVRLSLESLVFNLVRRKEERDNFLIAIPQEPIIFRGWQLDQFVIEREYADAKDPESKITGFWGVVSWSKDDESMTTATTRWRWI
ncbi:hypothetical protein [Agaribacter flavus]|uniref:Uncharacterized protein n=1 Tax=Agaribacter flavus TaxID=1902781 RepID=A0ABV7FU24_9ALTE